jgi:hypothetical protein
VPIPAQGGGSVALAAVTLTPGAWLLEGQTKVYYSPASPGSEWFDCELITASGTVLHRGTSRVGTDALAVAAATIPVRAAITVDVATQVTLRCSHPSSVPEGMSAEQSILQAIRAGSVEQQ